MSRKKTSSKAGKGPTQRMLRIGELVRHKVSELLIRGEIHDDVLASHVVSISEVRISPDLKLATAYVMPLGGKDTEKVIAALERHKKFIRAEVAQTLDLKYAPDIRFREDDDVRRGEPHRRLLYSEKVRRDVEKK